MAAERNSGSDRGRPVIDWAAASAYYAGLPGDRRSYQAVADEFGVSVRTVERHGRNDGWKQRARELDRQAAERVGEQIRDKRVEELLDTLKLIEASVVTFATQLRNGTVKVTPADLARLHKLRTEIWELTDVQQDEHEEPPARLEPTDQTERKRQVLRALDDAGVLQRLLRPERASDTDHEGRRDDDPDADDDPDVEGGA
jgi:hypothetical protein